MYFRDRSLGEVRLRAPSVVFERAKTELLDGWSLSPSRLDTDHVLFSRGKRKGEKGGGLRHSSAISIAAWIGVRAAPPRVCVVLDKNL